MAREGRKKKKSPPRSRLTPHAVGKIVNRPPQQGRDRQRKPGQRRVHAEQDRERSDQRDRSAKDSREAAVEKGLHRLRVVRDAKGRVGAAPLVVEMEWQ